MQHLKWIKTSADPRLLGALCKTVSPAGGGRVVSDETHLSVFHSVPNCAHGKRSRNSISSTARHAFNFQLRFFLSRARDCTTFTLHDLTDFYVERVTAHHIKINDSCFHKRWPNSKTKLKLGGLRSLRILRIGRIGSDQKKKLSSKLS